MGCVRSVRLDQLAGGRWGDRRGRGRSWAGWAIVRPLALTCEVGILRCCPDRVPWDLNTGISEEPLGNQFIPK